MTPSEKLTEAIREATPDIGLPMRHVCLRTEDAIDLKDEIEKLQAAIRNADTMLETENYRRADIQLALRRAT